MADTAEYTFEEENKRDTAARIIQRKARVRLARKNLVNLFKESYVKVYDEVLDQYVYKNKFTLEISYDKPRLLGSDDLPSPRKLEAPNEYNPGEENKEITGYALVVTVNEFNNEKLQTVPHSALSDHILLEDLLTHDFICKIPPENATFIKNPWLKAPATVLLTGFCLTFSTPLCCALFPQKAAIEFKDLDEDLKPTVAANFPGKNTFYYNKGL
jgi:hypothetical protein